MLSVAVACTIRKVVVLQPLAASSVFLQHALNVAVMPICNKFVDLKLANSKFCHCCWQLRQLQAKKFCISVYFGVE